MDKTDITKEVVPNKQPKRARKLAVPVLSYQMVDSASEAEIQQRLDRAFSILFDEVLRRRELKGNPQSDIDNNGQLRT